MILLNTNKQRWIIMILTIMITFACSKEEKDGISTLSDDTNGTASLTAVYEANWVVNQEVVGQCKYYVNGSRSYVDSYPSRYLFNWIDNYNKGDKADHGFEQTNDYNTFSSSDFDNLSGGEMVFNVTGNSSKSSYYNYPYTSSDNTIVINGKSYRILFIHKQGTPTAVHDLKADNWTVSWMITSVRIENTENKKDVIEHSFSPYLSMILITTKRIG